MEQLVVAGHHEDGLPPGRLALQHVIPELPLAVLLLLCKRALASCIEVGARGCLKEQFIQKEEQAVL